MLQRLGVLGRATRARYIFDYARNTLPAAIRGMLAASVRGELTRKPSDPPMADMLFYQNGKLRKLWRILYDYLLTEEGLTVMASMAPTVIDPPSPSRAKTRVNSQTRRPSSATTQTNDGDTLGWWEFQKRYETIKRIGKGGMGLVYEVKDTRTGRTRAARAIDRRYKKDLVCQARFFREVRAQSTLRNARVLRILEFGKDLYIAPLCRGSVQDLLRDGTLLPEKALDLFLQACAGAEAAHKVGVIHRDLEPGNLLLDHQGKLRVADFGLCKIDASDLTTVTRSRMGAGTTRYAPPEQMSDSLCRLYQMDLVVENPEALAAGPAVIFPRHASLLDVLLPFVVVGRPLGLRLRSAIKRELLWDPLVDPLGRAEERAFLRRDGADHAAAVAAVERLAAGLGPNDGAVIYPEGTRFTPRSASGGSPSSPRMTRRSRSGRGGCATCWRPTSPGRSPLWSRARGQTCSFWPTSAWRGPTASAISSAAI